MGGFITACKEHDKLIDHLVHAGFIHTPLIQKVFRAVDRSNYYNRDVEGGAYKDIAWRVGESLFLPVPCVNYCEILESLKLRPGLSFLNLGSGSGYLSTVVGLILGPYGINHAIELHEHIVKFANEKLEYFIQNADAINAYNFCEPKFYVGNGLLLDNWNLYDRVYCAPLCPTEYEHFMKCLIKIGGILIMPLNGKLVKITRTGEASWNIVPLLSVTFAPPMILPPSPVPQDLEFVTTDDFAPPTLKELCRFKIRSILRENIDKHHPTLKKKRFVELPNRTHIRRIFADSDSSDSESESDSDAPSTSSVNPTKMTELLEDFVRVFTHLQCISTALRLQIQSSRRDSDAQSSDEEEIDDSENATNSDNKELIHISSFKSMFDKTSNRDESQPSCSKTSNGDQSQPSCSKMSIEEKIRLRNARRQRDQYLKNYKTACTVETSPVEESEGNKRRASRKRAYSEDPEYRNSVKRTAATVAEIARNSYPKMEIDNADEVKVEDDTTYTIQMEKKLTSLPLPCPLKNFLNYQRNKLESQ